MIKITITNAIVSKGYNNQPTVYFSDKSDMVRFRVGSTVYDSRAENKSRWVNLTIKAFGKGFCERINKMNLTDGIRLNLSGRYDEEVWEDKDTHEKRSMPIMILEDIEFSIGTKNSNESQAPSGGYQVPGGAAPGPQYGAPNGAPGYGNQYGMPTGTPASGPQHGVPNGAPVPGNQYGAPGQDVPPAPPAGNFSGYENYGGGNNFF